MIQFLRGVCFIAASILMLALAWLAISTVRCERAITTATVATEIVVGNIAAELPGVLDARLTAIQGQTLKLADQHLTEIEGTLEGTARNLDTRLGSIQTDAIDAIQKQLGELNQTAALTAKALPPALGELNRSIAGVAADVHQVAVPAASVVGQVKDAAPMFLDCNPATGGGQDCLFNRYQGASKSFERTLKSIELGTPEMVQSAAKIEGHAEKIAAAAEREADALTKPKRFWQKLTAYLTLGGEVAAHLL